MSADEYWLGHPNLCIAYRDAQKLRMRYDNQVAWLQGMYNYQGVALAIGNSFGKKGAKKEQYPKEPASLGLETEQEKRFAAQREREKIIAFLNRFKASFDAANKSGENT